MKKEMISRKTWEEFRATGLLLIINQVLQVLGWVIVVVTNDTNEVVGAYTARTRFRGFENGVIKEAYTKVTKYMG